MPITPTRLSGATTEYTATTDLDFDADLIPVASSANGGKIAKMAASVFEGAYSRRQFGAKTFRASKYCINDNTSFEDAGIAALRAAAFASGGRVQVVFAPGRYYLSTPANLFELFSNLEIIAEGAEFIVGSVSDADWDTVAHDSFTYDNGIFYASSPTIDNFRFVGGTFTLTPAKLASIRIGSTPTHTSGNPANGGWVIEGLTQTGGQAPIVMLGQDVRIAECSTNLTATGLYMPANVHARVYGNRIRYAGVNSTASTWNNVQAIQANNCRDLVISGNNIDRSGGTAIMARSGTSEVYDVSIVGNTVTRAGLAGIATLMLSTGSALKTNGVTIANNVIRGFECSPGSSGNPHDGISVGANVASSVFRGATVTGNVVDYAGPDETFNTSTFTIADSTNTEKAAATNAGQKAGINIVGTSSTAYVEDVTVANNIVRQCKRVGIAITSTLNATVTGNTLRWNGYERDGSNLPYGSAHGIFVTSSAVVGVTGNNVHQHNPGCDGQNSANTMLIRASDSYAVHVAGNVLHGNDSTVAGSQWNNCAIGFSGSAFSGIGGFTSRTCSMTVGRNTIVGTYYGLSNGAGTFARHVSGTGFLTVTDDGFVARPTSTGTTNVEEGVTTVLMSHVSTGGTPTANLPSAALVPGQRCTVKHLGLGGDTVTVSAAAGSVVGATSLAAGAFAIYLAEGANWQQIA